MMKKRLLTLAAATVLVSSLLAQESNFDRKYRFGLRVTPQPTWFVSDDTKNSTPSGAKLGFGFGLNMEYKFSETTSLLTGVGADLEGARYRFRHEPENNYVPVYLMNESNELIAPNGSTEDVNNKVYKAHTAYVLKEREVKTTYLTIPLILKLSTKEIGGLRYSGLFGVEVGVRLNAKAKDSYYQTGKFQNHTYDTLFVLQPIPGIDSQSDIDIGKESSLIPLRTCFNAGLGAEYRLSGSTAVFFSINYFRSLTNMMKKESAYTFWKTEPSSGKSTLINQNLKMSGIRVSVGIMF
jgi:opacity protein-like surface antigen